MKKINVINKKANLNLISSTDQAQSISSNNYEMETIEGSHKGNMAPCVVFEDDNNDVYFVAQTRKEYLENINKEPPTVEELQEESMRSIFEMFPKKLKDAQKQIIKKPNITDEQLIVQIDEYHDKYDHAVKGLKIQPTQEELDEFNSNKSEDEKISLEQYRESLMIKNKIRLFKAEALSRNMTPDELRILIIKMNVEFVNAEQYAKDLIAGVKKKLIDIAEQIETVSDRNVFMEKLALVDKFDLYTPIDVVMETLDS